MKMYFYPEIVEELSQADKHLQNAYLAAERAAEKIVYDSSFNSRQLGQLRSRISKLALGVRATSDYIKNKMRD